MLALSDLKTQVNLYQPFEKEVCHGGFTGGESVSGLSEDEYQKKIPLGITNPYSGSFAAISIR
jgi:hypothetical protein